MTSEVDEIFDGFAHGTDYELIADFKQIFSEKKKLDFILPGLTRRQTVVYMLRQGLGWDYIDIAEQLNISIPAAYQIYQKARKLRTGSDCSD